MSSLEDGTAAAGRLAPRGFLRVAGRRRLRPSEAELSLSP